MIDTNQIEVTPEDEITLVDCNWLEAHRFGHKSTVKRKVKKQAYPQPISEPGEKMQWTLAQWKRFLQQRFNQQTAA